MIEKLQQEINRAFAAEEKLDWELSSEKKFELTFEVVSLNKYKFLSYENAKLYCFSLSVDGKTGWRLPTKEECEQLKQLWIFYNRIWIDQPDTVFDFSMGMAIDNYKGNYLVIPVRDIKDN